MERKCNVYTNESYSTIKKNKLWPHKTIWIDLKISLLMERNQTQWNDLSSRKCKLNTATCCLLWRKMNGQRTMNHFGVIAKS